MQGVTILEVYSNEVSTARLIAIAILSMLIVILGGYGIISVIIERTSSILYNITFFMIFVFFVLFGSRILIGVQKLTNHKTTSYRVVIDESVNMSEFLEMYEIEEVLDSGKELKVKLK